MRYTIRLFTTSLLSILILACTEERGIKFDTYNTGDTEVNDTYLDAGSEDALQRVDSCKPVILRNQNQDLQDKFSLSLFHYNIQYIAGGGEKYENAIIRIGFEPILDILLRHPNWKFTIEMQGYMLEIMAERYPKTFQKLKGLVENCQVELVVFHYSDQLFLAYPEEDMEWSFELNQDVFVKLGLYPSGVVFTQEGQFGEGMLKFMKTHNYSIGLYPKNLFRYFSGNIEVKPLYSKYDTDVVIVGAGVNNNGIIVDWSYFNDGELLTTGGYSPYFVDTGNYKVDEEAIKKYEDELTQKEKEGYAITTVGNYVATIKAKGIKPEPLPALLDGTWQPDDTSNLHRWMGDAKGQIDRDNDVLTSNYRARKYVLTLKNLIEYARTTGVDVSEYESKLFLSKRYLALAEVSDSTGWYPNKVEVDYSLTNSEEAKKIALASIKDLVSKIGINKILKIDNLEKQISEVDSYTEETIDEVCNIPSFISEIKSDFYKYEIFCKKLDEKRTDYRIVFTPINTSAVKSATLKLNFDSDEVEYIPALMDREGAKSIVRYKSSEFARTELNTSLATGLIKLKENLYFIKHCEYFHISPFIDFANRVITFIDNSPNSEGFEWRFSIINGDINKAVYEMQRINTYPVVYIAK